MSMSDSTGFLRSGQQGCLFEPGPGDTDAMVACALIRLLKLVGVGEEFSRGSFRIPDWNPGASGGRTGSPLFG
jgi:hypothetical protein